MIGRFQRDMKLSAKIWKLGAWGSASMGKITVMNQDVAISTVKEEDYISLTDFARYKDSERTDDLIRNWLHNRNTLEFLGIWEHLNNPGFKPVEFDGFRMQAGLTAEDPQVRENAERARENLLRLGRFDCLDVE